MHQWLRAYYPSEGPGSEGMSEVLEVGDFELCMADVESGCANGIF